MMSTQYEPPMVWPDTPRVRESDPIESHIAGDVSASSVAASQAAVLRILTDALMPLTDNDLVGYLRGRFSPSRVRTARHELEEDGRVVCAGSVLVRTGNRRTPQRTWTVVA